MVPLPEEELIPCRDDRWLIPIGQYVRKGIHTQRMSKKIASSDEGYEPLERVK